MNLVKLLSSNIKEKHWWQHNEPVVVAVSAGVDSMVLLYLLNHLTTYHPKIIVAHVNHELRQASEREEEFIRQYCYDHNLSLMVDHWPKNDHPKTGVENAARQFRYNFFHHVMNEYHSKVLLTAHHLNDQAETIMMKLIRGDDINQLTGIHEVRSFAQGQLIRPLLSVKKATIRSFAKRNRLMWFEDQTNYSLKITRNRIRHLLLPKMAEENPRVLEHFAQYSTQLQSLINTNQFLTTQIIDQMKLNSKSSWNSKELFKYPRSVQKSILAQLFQHYYNHLVITPNLMKEIIKLLNDNKKPQGYLKLNNHVVLQKEYSSFIIKKQHRFNVPKNKYKNFEIQLNHWISINNHFNIGVFNDDMLINDNEYRISHFYLNDDDFPLKVRSWNNQDKLRLKNGGHQKIRRVFIDKKINNNERQLAKVLVTKRDQLLALLGYKESVTLNDANKKRYALVVQFK